MTVRINKKALNLREEIAKAQSNNAEEARIGSLVSDSIDAVAIDAESLVVGDFTSTGIDDNAPSLTLTIDANGDVLIGKTAASLGTVGAVLYKAGLLRATRSGGYALELNRLASDGSIVDLKKDGTTVGSIGSASGGLMGIGTGDVGLKFYAVGDAIMPSNPSSTFADRAAAISLGFSGNAFKDLYLSGGVYLGGTGAANLLDDYEEGTWTPTNAGDATGTISTAEGVYTKVGRMVVVEGVFVVSGNFTTNVIGGLPFTVTAHLTASGIAQNGRAITQTSDDVQAYAAQGGSTIGFVNDGNATSAHPPTTTNGTYRFSITYQTA